MPRTALRRPTLVLLLLAGAMACAGEAPTGIPMSEVLIGSTPRKRAASAPPAPVQAPDSAALAP